MAVSLKTDLRFPESGQHGHGSRIIHVDYEMIQRGAKAIFDTKNVMKNVKARENIEAL